METFLLFSDYADTIRGMSDLAAGILIKMVFNHVTGADELDGVTTSGEDMLDDADFSAARVAAGFICRQIDRSAEAYDDIKAKRRDAGAKGAAKRWQTIASDGKPCQTIAKDSKTWQPMASDSKAWLPNPIPNPNPIYKKESTKKKFQPPTVEQVREYCAQRSNSVNPEAFVDFYTSKGWKVGKASMKDWRAAVRTWEKREPGGMPAHMYDFDELEKELLQN